MSAALAAYRLTTALLEPLAPMALNKRAARGKEDPIRMGERLGRATLPRPSGEVIWLHGASVGESLSLLPLIAALAQARPDLTLLVTSGTVTSAQLLGARLPTGAVHQYIPVDAPGAVRRFLAHWRPRLAVFVESELWPNLLLGAKAAGCRLALLGARVSEDSAKGWARSPAAAAQLFAAFDLILAQDNSSRARLQALGAEVAGVLDLKLTGSSLPHDGAALSTLKAMIGDRPVVVAASTHPGEETLVLAAFKALPPPRPLLILVPRHPARADEIADLIEAEDLPFARRSLEEPLTGAAEIYLADTLGELGLFFRLADVAVIGGGFGEGVGGHNPLEPARLGLSVITGPDVANFRQAYAGLIEAGAAVTAPDAPGLASHLARLLADPAMARDMGVRGKAYAERGDAALADALAALQPLLPA